MSITIFWRPDKPTVDRRFSSGTSTSFERLSKALGNNLSESDIPVLRAMAVAAQDDFYNEVANTIEQAGPIVVCGKF